MKKGKFNQDEFGWTLNQLREDIETSNKLKSKEIKQNKEIEQKKLAVKDRLDLSLKQFNEMVGKIESLEANNKFYEMVFNDLHIKDFLHLIDFKSVKVNLNRDDLRLTQKVHISFDIEPLI